MKYEIPQDRLDKIIFKYLDVNLKGLEKRKPKYYKGIVFAYPDEEFGILGWKNDGTLYIFYELIDEISNNFGLKENDLKETIRIHLSPGVFFIKSEDQTFLGTLVVLP